METEKLPFNDADIPDRINQVHDLPILCNAIGQVWENISEDGMASVEELASLIRYDQILAAKVLRAANSTIFGKRKQILTLDEGIEFIGTEKVRSICLSSLLKCLISDREKIDASLKESFWKHSYLSARIASMIVQKRTWVSTQQAYILGLIHDIGRTAAATCFSESYRFLEDLARARKIPVWHVECQYGFSHTQLGLWLAIKWGLPEVFQNVIAFHHLPEKTKKFRPEVKLIHLADILANADHYPELIWDKVTLSSLRDLYISEGEWEDCIQSLGNIKDEAEQIWNMVGQERTGDGAFS